MRTGIRVRTGEAETPRSGRGWPDPGSGYSGRYGRDDGYYRDDYGGGDYDTGDEDFDGDDAEPGFDETAELSAVTRASFGGGSRDGDDDTDGDSSGDWTGADHVWPNSHRQLSRVLFALGCLAAVLALALVFIVQNAQNVQIAYFDGKLRLPLGVALLLGIVVGIMLVVIPGTARIVHLRLTRKRRTDAG